MKSLIVTDSGNELIARVIAGETTISFTRIAVSDCDYSEIDVKQIKDLQQIKQTVPISKISRLDKNMIEVLAAIENRQVEEAYFVYALGIYAKDSNENEILYGVSLCDENPDYMPVYEGKVLSGISYRLDIVVGDSEQVLLDVNPAAVATTLQVEQIENDLIRHTQDREIHVTEEKQKKWDAVEDKVDKVKGKGLSENDFTNEDKEKLDGIAEGANKTVIVNNLITTEAGFALDGRQGYALDRKIADLKKSVADGKSAIASAISKKGVSTATDATFSTMSANILKITSDSVIEILKKYSIRTSNYMSMQHYKKIYCYKDATNYYDSAYNIAYHMEDATYFYINHYVFYDFSRGTTLYGNRNYFNVTIYDLDTNKETVYKNVQEITLDDLSGDEFKFIKR